MPTEKIIPIIVANTINPKINVLAYQKLLNTTLFYLFYVYKVTEIQKYSYL